MGSRNTIRYETRDATINITNTTLFTKILLNSISEIIKVAVNKANGQHFFARKICLRMSDRFVLITTTFGDFTYVWIDRRDFYLNFPDRFLFKEMSA